MDIELLPLSDDDPSENGPPGTEMTIRLSRSEAKRMLLSLALIVCDVKQDHLPYFVQDNGMDTIFRIIHEK